MNYKEKIKAIKNHYGWTWAEFAAHVGTTEVNIKNTVNSLDVPNRQRQPVAWNLVFLIFDDLLTKERHLKE